MQTSVLKIVACSNIPHFCAVISTVEPENIPTKPSDVEYTVSVTNKGFTLTAADKAGLIHAFYTTLQLFYPSCLIPGKVSFKAPYALIYDRPMLKFRGLHLCVFPETTLLLLEKAIRLAGLMKFTHIVLEFWGSLEFEALPELYWKDHYYTKYQIKPLIDLVRGLGMQVIPMFNHLGHASGSRECFGRHVILNQNPQLALLFEPDGWSWCLSNPKTLELLQKVREELMDLCGEGDYFFIGCDEARSFATCDLCRPKNTVKMLASYLNSIVAELKKQNRRVIMWGDALLDSNKWQAPNIATGNTTHTVVPQLNRDIIIADWQYEVFFSSVPTAQHFLEQGFDTLLCPFDNWVNIESLSKAAKDLKALGMLATTWDRLPTYIKLIPDTASLMWNNSSKRIPLTQTATLLRKLLPTNNFSDSGWSSYEVKE